MKPKRIKDIDLNTLKPGQKVWVEGEILEVNKKYPYHPLKLMVLGYKLIGRPFSGVGCITESQLQQSQDRINELEDKLQSAEVFAGQLASKLPDLEGLEWVRHDDEKPGKDDCLDYGYVYVTDGGLLADVSLSTCPEEYDYWLRNSQKLYDFLNTLPIAEKPDPGYGYTLDGKKIEPPEGWEIVPEGGDLPKSNLEYMVFCDNGHGWREHSLASRKAGLSTYTDQWKVRAYARRKDPRILVDLDTGERFEVVDGKVLKEVEG